MIIGIDIDDTISNTYETINTYAQLYVINDLNRKLKFYDVQCKDHSYTRQIFNFSDEEDKEFFQKYYEIIVKQIKAKTLASEYLNKLKEENNKIVLITARWDSKDFDIENLTKQWLKENNIPYDKIIMNSKDKLKICQEENVDVFIDDSFKFCKDVASSNIKSFIMNSPTNQGLVDDNVTRVYSWPHLYKEIKSLEGK